jgi:hypothetical protein
MYYHDSHVVEIIRNERESAYVLRGARWPVNICIFSAVVNILCPFEGSRHILKALSTLNLYLVCKHA